MDQFGLSSRIETVVVAIAVEVRRMNGSTAS